MTTVDVRRPTHSSTASVPIDTTLQVSESRFGMRIHRMVYRGLTLIPRGPRQWVIGRAFDTLFTITPDAWGYTSSTYELTKRRHLIDAVPSHASTIVEFGCANGHNLAALSRERPNASVIGVDVSRNALKIAGRRLSNRPNVRLLWTGARLALAELPRLGVDVLVLAEVLYYLGSDDSIEQTLGELRAALSPNATVVMLHTCTDAARLHAAAAHALQMPIASSQVRKIGGRVFLLSVASAAELPSRHD